MVWLRAWGCNEWTKKDGSASRQGSWTDEEWRKKEKKMKGRREGQWLGSAASGGRGGSELSKGDGSIDNWAGEMVRQGGGREKNI